MFTKLLYSHPWRIVSSLLIQLDATKKLASQENLCLFLKVCFSFVLGGTLLACTASTDNHCCLVSTQMTLSGRVTLAVASGTPLLCVCGFHCKPLAEAK